MVCDDQPWLSVLALVEVFLKDRMLFNWHFLVPYRAHVVVVAVIDVGFIWIHKADFEGFPCRLRSVLVGHVLGTLWFVKVASLSFDPKVLT